MISLFKSNNLLVVIFYALYLIIFRIYFVFNPQDPSFVFRHQEPFSSGILGLLLKVPVNFFTLSVVLSAVLCFIQALWMNNIVNSNKILPKKTYLPGALFVIFSSFIPSYLFLTPASISFTLLIVATSGLFSVVRKEKANGDIFDVGFMTAMAALFYTPSLLFILFMYIGLSTLRAFSYREWVILLSGFLSPYIMLFTFYFWQDNLSLLPSHLFNNHSLAWLSEFQFRFEEWLMLAASGTITLISLMLLPAALYSTVIQTRKFSILLALFVVFTIASFFLQQYAEIAHGIFLSLPLAIIVSFLLHQVKTSWLSELIHLILILLVLTGQYYPQIKNLFT